MLIPFADWLPDRPDYANAGLTAQNCVPYADRYRPQLALAAISNAMPTSPPLAAINTGVAGGDVRNFFATATKLYRLDTDTFIDVSRTASAYTTSPYWAFVQALTRVIAASRTNVLQYTTVATANLFQDIPAPAGGIASDVPKANVIGTVRNFVFVGDVDDVTDGVVPHRVRWNAIGQPLDWPYPGSANAIAKQADQQDLKTEDGAVQAIVGTEYGVIFQERSITRASYVGAPVIFQMDRIDSSRGAWARKGWATVGRRIFFIARDGFFVNQGDGESVPIGDGKVDKFFFDNVSVAYKDNIRAVADPSRKLVFFAFPSRASTGIPDTILVYSYEKGRWTTVAQSAWELLSGRTQGLNLDTPLPSELLDIPGSLDDPIFGPGEASMAAIDSAFKFATFSGAALTATIDTGEFQIEGSRSFLSRARPIVDGDNMTVVTVASASRTKQGDSITFGSPVTPYSRTGDANFRVDNNFHRLRVVIAGGFKDAVGIETALERSGYQ